MKKLLTILVFMFGLSSIASSQSLAGTCWKGYYPLFNDMLTLDFGASTLSLYSSSGTYIIDAVYWTSGNTVSIYDLPGPISCPMTDTGRYTFSFPTGNSIDFLTLSEPCAGREAFLTGVSFLDCFTATNEIISSPKALRLYPNPSHGQFSVELDWNKEATIEIIDISGKIIYSQTLQTAPFQVDMPSIAKGVYVLRVHAGGNRYMERVVVF